MVLEDELRLLPTSSGSNSVLLLSVVAWNICMKDQISTFTGI